MRILVVDDHPLIRDAIGAVAARIDAAAEVLHAGDCERGFALAAAGPEPDLLLLDLHLPGIAGVDALNAWRRRHPSLPIVVLSADRSRATVLAALAAGASGFIPKSTGAEVMAGALRIVLDGGRYLPPEVLAEALPPAATRRPALPAQAALGLTDRQMQVVRLVARGAPNKLIGRELGMAERTVKAHITAAFQALAVTSRTQLAVAAARLGLDGEGRKP